MSSIDPPGTASELAPTLTNCPDCSVTPGIRHEDGCDVSRCPECGTQALQCGDHLTARQSTWTGEWPGDAECREWGWFTDVTYPDGEVETVPDLNELFPALMRGEIYWDKQTERYKKVAV